MRRIRILGGMKQKGFEAGAATPMERIEELVREELLRNGEFAPTLRR